jgi:hypothetical protein
MLYHGAIDGATLANGQLLEGGIALGREDLALVGADYYAMGHVHLAQQIPGLPAYYAGSAFPVDWAEVDVKGCNLVELEPLGGLGPDETGTGCCHLRSLPAPRPGEGRLDARRARPRVPGRRHRRLARRQGCEGDGDVPRALPRRAAA